MMGKFGGSENLDLKTAAIAKKIALKRPYGIQLKTLKLCFEKAFTKTSPVEIPKEENKPTNEYIAGLQCFTQNSTKFNTNRSKLLKCLGIRNMHLKQKQYESSKKFKKLHDLWKGRTIYVEPSSIRRKTRHRGLEQSPDDYSQHRVNTKFSFHTGDVVRSEKEFLETLQSLASAEGCIQEDSGQNTTVKIPNMLENLVERSLFPMNNSNGKLLNPKEYFIGCSEADNWTSKEKRIFLKAFLKFPKQFGRISGFLPSKTTSQCILYYYRNKFSLNLNSLLEEKSYCDNMKPHNKNHFGLNKRQAKSNVSKFKPLKTKQEKEVTPDTSKPNNNKSQIEQAHNSTLEGPVPPTSYLILKNNPSSQIVKNLEIQGMEVTSDSATEIMSLNQEDVDDTPQVQSSCASPKNNIETDIAKATECLVKEGKVTPTKEIFVQETYLVNENLPNKKPTEKVFSDTALPQNTTKSELTLTESPKTKPEIKLPYSPVLPRAAKIDALLNSPTSTDDSKKWNQTAILEWFRGHAQEDPDTAKYTAKYTAADTATDYAAFVSSPRPIYPTQAGLISKPKPGSDQSLTTNNNEPGFNNSSTPFNKPTSSYLKCNSPNENHFTFLPPTELINSKPTISALNTTSYSNLHINLDSYRDNIIAACPPGYAESHRYHHNQTDCLASRLNPNPNPNSKSFLPQQETSFEYLRPQLVRESQHLNPVRSFRYIQPSSHLTLFSHSENIPAQFRFHRPVIDLQSNYRTVQNTPFPYSDYGFQSATDSSASNFSRSQKHILPGYDPQSLSGSFTHNSQFVNQSLLQKSLQESQFQYPSHPHLLHRPIIQTSRTSLRAPTEPLPNLNGPSNFYQEHSSNLSYLSHLQHNVSSSSVIFPEVSQKQGSVPPRFDQKDAFKKI